MIDVLVVGGIGVDHNVRVPALPPPNVDTILVPPISSHLGHAGYGVAAGYAAQGLRTVICDVIGEDLEGRMVRDYYAASAVELRAVTHAAGTRRSVNLVAPDGTRTSLYDPRHPYDLLPDSALWRDGLRQARLVHAVIVNWARHPLREAVAQGVLTATDLQDWDGTNLHHREFAELADLVFMSSANLGQRAPEVAGSVLAEGRARMVAVTRGAAGSTVYPRAGEPFEVPAVPLPAGTVLDSNGAGDAFAAAFTAEVLRGETLEKAGEAGAIAGAVAIVADGDVAALAAG